MIGFQPRGRLQSQQGLSLVELMISMVLGLAIVAAVGTLSVNALRSYRALSQASEQIENGRYALKIIRDDLEHAGFWGAFNPANTNLPASQPDPCTTPAPPFQNLIDSFPFPVTGTCTASLTSKVNGTKALILLRADSRATLPADVGKPENAGKTYLQTTPAAYVIGKGATAAAYSLQKPDGSTADIRQLHVRIYYIRSYSQTGDGIPTLMRKDPIDSDTNAQALVEGIENLQIQYGIDSDRDGSPNSYTASPASMADWSNVIAVKTYVLARSLDPTPGYTDTKSYDLGNLSVTPGGPYHRRVFSQTIRLINASGRREP